MEGQNDGHEITLDEAIEECESYIKSNRRSAQLLLLGLLQLGLLAVMGGAYLFIYLPRFETASPSTLVTSVVSGMLILISIVIGVLVSLYRFHLMEIARTEHYKIGFLRIRVAAINSSPGFGSEVRSALTEGAFFFESSKKSRTTKIESPLPGHPTSDISTAIINKVFEAVEVTLKPKRTSRQQHGD